MMLTALSPAKFSRWRDGHLPDNPRLRRVLWDLDQVRADAAMCADDPSLRLVLHSASAWVGRAPYVGSDYAVARQLLTHLCPRADSLTLPIAATEPDVILASYSGLTQEEYDTLSKIAPVVAYPELAWGTTYQTMIEMNSTALGLADEGEQLIADLESEVQAALAAHDELVGKKLEAADNVGASAVACARGQQRLKATRDVRLKPLGPGTGALLRRPLE